LELHPEFQIELIASEPLVSDPIDMEIDENGLLYVLEMHGYPQDQSGSDRIVTLRDTDGDGRMDERTVFADSLVLPMGIMRWKEGLLVTDSPNVLYLEDTDGDGRADVEQKVLTGFHTSDPESDVNNPTFGLDNWIYLANGPTSDSDIHFVDQSEGPRIPQQATNRNVRFHPDNYRLEAQSSQTQFGFAFDTWGHQFLVNNRNHIYQEVIASRYLRRNPDLLVSDATESISDHGSAAEVFPITTNPNPQLLTDLGEFTAACGITFYQGGAFPAGFERVSFVAEPAHNLIHADRLSGDGPTFVASRLRPNTEFLASTDAWFRPVNMYIGPDGALYVVDYYRQIIEGPEWLSDEVLESGDLYNGSTMGRIYRITPKGTGPATWTTGLQFGGATSVELIEQLDASNIWWRRNAQRLLLDRGDQAVIAKLIQMAQDTTSTSAPGRLHALWTLEGLERLRPELIMEALQDPVAGIRENAIKLAERHLGVSPSLQSALLKALVPMRSDPDPKVRYQLLLTLGFVETPAAARVRQELLFESIDNKWMQIAALSAPSSQSTDLLDTVIGRYEPAYASLVRRLGAMAGAHHQPGRVRRLAEQATAADAPTSADAPGTEEWQVPLLEGLARGLGRREEPLPPSFEAHRRLALQAFFEHPVAAVRTASLQVLQAAGLSGGSETQTGMQNALQIAGSAAASPERRAQALEFVALGDPAPHISFLKELIVPGEPATVQVAALRALSAVPGTTVSRYVLQQWPLMTPEVRRAALAAFLVRPFEPGRIKLLLDAIASGTVQPASIDWPSKVTLMRDVPDTLKQRGRSLLARPAEVRQEEIAEYVKAVEERTARANQGRDVFLRHCASCHQLGNVAEGATVGPDLMSVRGWRPADIVEHTAYPSKAITRGYDLWRVTLRSGGSVQGIIGTETPNAITLRSPSGEETTIARRDIESLSNLNVSVMPPDFRERISPQEMADLVAFIRRGE
jgi:putative membrane-bound dehydrogenase-like protein